MAKLNSRFSIVSGCHRGHHRIIAVILIVVAVLLVSELSYAQPLFNVTTNLSEKEKQALLDAMQTVVDSLDDIVAILAVEIVPVIQQAVFILAWGFLGLLLVSFAVNQFWRWLAYRNSRDRDNRHEQRMKNMEIGQREFMRDMRTLFIEQYENLKAMTRNVK